ncbi:MAG TPA: tetratricopeptide repeat protein, partial [Bacteroidetes bacterium]|nr:tetratricopeptide repeat protein [Bacteroidota bacterium]
VLSLKLTAQTPEIDSLRNIVNTTQIDTVKVNTLILLSQKIRRTSTEDALDTINLCVQIAENVKFNYGLAEAYKEKGIALYMTGQIDSAIRYSYIAVEIHENHHEYAAAARVYNNIGIYYRNQGKLQESINSLLKAIELLEKADDKQTLVAIYINLSNIYRNIGNFQKALECNFSALDILDNYELKNSNDSLQTAHIYKSIANIYTDQKDIEQAEINYNKALEIYFQVYSPSDIGDIYLNLGVLQRDKSFIYPFNTPIIKLSHDFSKKLPSNFNYLKAKEYYLKALNYYQNKNKIITACLNIGEAYTKLKDFDSAFIYYNQALLLSKEIGDGRGIAISLTAFGTLNNDQDNFSEAIKYLSEAIEIAEEIGDISILLSVSEAYSLSLKMTGNYKKALEMHELYKQMNDSIFNTNNERSLTQMSMSYEFEKEKEQAQLKHQEEIKRQKIIQKFSFAVLLLTILILISVFSSLRIKKRKNRELKKMNAEIMQQKEEIETQRDEIEAQKDKIEAQSRELEKQRDIAIKRGDEIEFQKKEIEASIRYALRIQEAVLPTIEPLKTNFNDFFIFFKPKDIVSGDFYWTLQKNNKVIAVAADCTGHGVPGAFMSMLGITFLNQIVGQKTELNSDTILNKLRQMVMKSLKQNAEAMETSRDGMDIALLVYNSETQILEYSGDYNWMFLITKREIEKNKKIRTYSLDNQEKTLYEFRADRMPIGVFIIEMQDFSKHTIKLEKDDRIYIFSDGYPDMYDREKGLKFTTQMFKELLLETSDVDMKSQSDKLEEVYIHWCRGGKQIDDIIVIGIEV